jgi:hypothetical protein
MNIRAVAASLLLGIVGNFVAAAVLSFNQTSVPVAVIAFAAAAVMAILLGYLVFRLNVLRTIGIRNWEVSITSGTSTRDCIVRSQNGLDFLGIAASKWNREAQHLRKMLVRHASNGGRARFLLLNPDGEVCRHFETIKNVPTGSVSAAIKENVVQLQRLADEGLPVQVRFYDSSPHFRIVVIDNNLLILGIYSYLTDSGEDTPQLLLDGTPRAWSFYYSYTSYFEKLWNAAMPVVDKSVPKASLIQTAGT